MLKTLRRGTVVLAASIGLVAGSSGPAAAGAPPDGQGAYTVLKAVCTESGDAQHPLEIGGQLRMKEFGKHRVVQLKVQYLLYAGKPSTLNPSQVRKTYSSVKFPNDNKNYVYATPYHDWDVVSGDQPWYLVAKMTWVRAGARDWNVKGTVAICS